MDKKIDLIKKETRKPSRLVKKFKKKLISATIEDYAKDNDLMRSYRRLISGLDQDSIDTVHKILLRELQTAKGKAVTFTQEETEQLSKLNNTFKAIKLNKECYAYKQYLLPVDRWIRCTFGYENGIHELKNRKYFEDKAIIDVGAFIADTAIVFAPYIKGKIHAFEPQTENYELMIKTIKFNNIEDKVIPIKKGLGAKNEIHSMPKNWCSGYVTTKQKDIEGYENVEITTLDDYVKENNLQVGLIKVDIEGAEQDFLKGAEQTIKTQRPSLLISIYHNAADFFEIKPMIESWNLGYKFRIVKHMNGHPSVDTLLVAEVPEEGE